MWPEHIKAATFLAVGQGNVFLRPVGNIYCSCPLAVVKGLTEHQKSLIRSATELKNNSAMEVDVLRKIHC